MVTLLNDLEPATVITLGTLRTNKDGVDADNVSRPNNADTLMGYAKPKGSATASGDTVVDTTARVMGSAIAGGPTELVDA